MIIRDIADCERPYEKAVELGIEALNDAELIATIIRTGTRDSSSIDLAHRVLNNHHMYKGLNGLNYMSRDDLLSIKGIGNTKATQLLAVSELSRRMVRQRLKRDMTFDNPQSIASYYQEKCKYINRERLYMMVFDSAMHLVKEVLLSEGTVNQSLMSARDVFIQALKYEAVNIILIHNHPSGNVIPSQADIQSTKVIKTAGRLMDINLADHIIVGNSGYTSMLERGIIDEI
ncbi:MAG: DNA repair protein RadC [Lachnospiraceae bacterium]|nr:DNA repair protein RadC [Lachnospiraceae bacterium]